VLQICIVTFRTSVTTEEHVTKMSVVYATAAVRLALAADTVKEVGVALLMYSLVGASSVMAKKTAR